MALTKKKSLPFFPLGFTDFSAECVSCGLIVEEKDLKKLYLAVWVLRGNKRAVVPIKGSRKAKVGYPTKLSTDFMLKKDVLTVRFSESNSARFFEIEF